MHGLYISFWLPTVVLGAALAIKLPSILKLWRDPLLRAVGGLLLFACAVFVFAAPKTIAWTNRVTGVPNIAAPWVYSLLTALSASWLLLVIAWRNNLTERSAQTRRATRWVVSVYAGVVVALWVLFALADVPVERIRDLDTYYANTPFMREEILLYLLAHTVACSVTAGLIWNWSRTEGLDAWLRWGLRFLGAGYVTNLLFSAAKLTAVGARWTGHDLDWLNTNIAPSAACIAATLVAIGFIVPHAGQYLQERWRVRRRHRGLKPLARLMRSVVGTREPLALRATPELRLIRRETFIRDAVLQLSRYLDDDLRARSYDAAVALGFDRGRAQALAAAVTIQEAVAARTRSTPPPTLPHPNPPTPPQPSPSALTGAAGSTGASDATATSELAGASGPAGASDPARASGPTATPEPAGTSGPTRASDPAASSGPYVSPDAATQSGPAVSPGPTANAGAAAKSGSAPDSGLTGTPRPVADASLTGSPGPAVSSGPSGSTGLSASSGPSGPTHTAPTAHTAGAGPSDSRPSGPYGPSGSGSGSPGPVAADGPARSGSSGPSRAGAGSSGFRPSGAYGSGSAGPAAEAGPGESGSGGPAAEAGPGGSGSGGPDTTYLLREIQAVSEVLRHPEDIDAVRELAVRPGREHVSA